MFGLPILEVAIGISFVYLLLALICTTLNETIAAMSRRRAGFLGKGINSLLGNDPALSNRLFGHPLVAQLAQKPGKKPSYLPASKFALALMDILTGPSKRADDTEALMVGIKSLSSPLQTVLSAVLSDSNQREATDQQKIEAWYNGGMDRVSGWYKRRTTLWIWILAAIVTVSLNADSIHISTVLWTNQAVRSAVVESAKARAQSERPEDLLPVAVHNDPKAPKKATAVLPHGNAVLTKEEQAELGQLLTCWSDELKQWKQQEGWKSVTFVISLLVGWFVTIITISLGAPFWFDTLNRFMNIRAAGRAPDEPRDKSSGPGPNA